MDKMNNKLRGFEVVKDDMRKTEGEIKLPTRASKHSAGYDFYLPYEVTIPPHCSTGIIPTDVKAYMQEGEVLMLYVRSSIGIKKGLVLANGTGIVDRDYFSNPDNDGNIGIALRNDTNKTVVLEKGERIMQGVFVKYLVADDDDVKDERTGGFGSSGQK